MNIPFLHTLRSNVIQVFPLDVYFSHKWHNAHATNTSYNMRCSAHLGIVTAISILESADRSAQIDFYFV